MFWVHVVSDYANIKLKDQQYVYSVPVSFYFKNTLNSQVIYIVCNLNFPWASLIQTESIYKH